VAVRIDRPRFCPIDDSRDGLATRQDLAQIVAELKQEAAGREARMSARLTVATGVVLTALGVAATLLAVFG